MNRIIIITFSILICLFTNMASGQDKLDGYQVAKMVDQRPDGDDYTGTMKMTLINKRGSSRVREFKMFSLDFEEGTKGLTYFTAPADVRGTGFLQYEYDNPDKEDDRWLYLPALKKSRRISGSSDSDSFMGSDFTYDDWGGFDLEENKYELLREETISGHECWVLKVTPIDEDSIYSSYKTWIRKDALLDIKVEYFDRSGAMLKTLTVDDLRNIDGYWTPFKMTMKNVQDDHTTVIEQLDISYDTGLDSSLFRVSSLERGRVR
jgi:outer membrane lipoprotein-sorting protein